MATTIEDCEKVCETVADTGLKYMMAETVVYSREFLFIKEQYRKGELGKLQYLAASHPQDMDGWPSYWEKMIPMHYATHVVSPCLGLVDGVAEYVSCFGSGTVRDDIAKKSGNKFAVESCHIKIKDSDVACHIWRFLYDVARQYRESFDVYGTKKSFEWTLVEHEPHVIHTAKKPEPEIPKKIQVPDLRPSASGSNSSFTLPQEIHDSKHLSFIQGGGHGGSHPHLVNEFVSALHRESRSVAQRHAIGQLDVRGDLRPPVGGEGRRDRAAAELYAANTSIVEVQRRAPSTQALNATQSFIPLSRVQIAYERHHFAVGPCRHSQRPGLGVFWDGARLLRSAIGHRDADNAQPRRPTTS